jgi:hypothetical protein
MESLVAWAEAYVKHRDLFEKRIAAIETDGERLLIKNKDGTVVLCLPVETLDETVLVAIAQQQKALLITRNRKENLAFLIKHWTAFAKHQGLKVVFANVAAHEKWVIVPNSHHAVADPESLALGLQAMFDQVPEG